MSTISSTRNDDQCSGFEPQNWRRDRCKKCFRLKEQHTRSRSGSENIGSKMKKLIPSSRGSKSLDLGQVSDSKIATSLAASSSWHQKFQTEGSSVEKCCMDENRTGDEISVQKSKENGATDKGEPEISYTAKTIDGNVVAASDDDENSKPPPPPTLARKTRLVILKAEVSVDGNPVADEISVETSIGSDSPSARSPCAATASTTSTIRQKSPDTQSYKSFDGSVASSSEYLSARSAPIGSRSRTSSCESVASTLMVKNDGDDVDRISLTGSDFLHSEDDDDDDERSLTPTAGENGGVLRRKLRSLRVKLKTLERRCSDLTKENERYKKTSALVSPSAHPTQNLETLQTELVKSETLCQNYQIENERLRDELSSAVTPKAPGRLSSANTSSLQSNNNKENCSSREKLSAAEKLCEELLNENEDLKTDLRDMQQELEEMRDQYREEEIDEFRDLQRELEQTAKNCRILQFKLRKAERRNDQTESDRQHLQEKIREILNNNGAPLDAVVDSPRLRELESELRIAKEVSVRLHNELEAMDEKRCKLEDENFCFRERIRELEAREKIIDISRPKAEQQKKYNHDGTEIVCRLPPTSNSESQLLRNLQDALERETDLRDQLKFAEHDIKMARKSVSDLETENECLMRQLSKISSTKSLSSAMTNDSSSSQQQSQNGGDDRAKKGGINAGRPSMKRSLSEGHAQIELELAEQEAQVLRSKLERMERDKDNLVSKISLLEKEAGKLGGRTQFSDDELRTMVPDTYYKQKIKILEEEVEEWKIKLETMQKAEADQDSLDRSKFPKPVSTTTTPLPLAASSANVLKDADLKFKHDILEREVSILRRRLVSLELENERISSDNRRLMTRKNIPIKIAEKIAINGGAEMSNAQEPLSLQDKVSKMEGDARRFLNRIADLEKEKEQLSTELERRKRLENIKRGRKNLSSDNNDDNFDAQSVCLELQDKVNELIKENDMIKSDFKNVQQRAGNNETQLAEYKQIIGMSDDQKLITMATKVEVLTNQLKEVQTRYDTFHKSMTVGRDPSNPHSEKYEDVLKQKIECLEKELSEQKAKARAPWRSDFRDYLCSQLAQLESTLRNSKIKQDTIPIAEKVKHFYDSLKSIDTENDPKGAASLMRGSDLEVIIRQLKGQLDQSILEKSNAIQECERATTRLLQTEERWNKELEKLRESYENQMKDLKYYLEESEKIKEEKSCSLLERTASLNEKTKRLNECESKIQRLELDLKQKYKDLQDKLDAEKKRAKEFETKYQKLESLYETDRQKLNSEKEKFKADLSEIKKRYEETQMDFEKLKATYERKENGWASEKIEYEKRLSKLVDDAKEIEIKAAKKAQEMSSVENQKLLASLEELKQSMDSENEKLSKEKQDSKSRLESTIKEKETLSKEIERLKKELETAISQIKDQKQQLEETRRVRDETKEEMQRWQQTWTKERAELAHKMRQEEKVQQAEQQALHLKYESKIKIIEDSNKRVQIQLTQARREKDQFRESVLTLEKTMAENGKKAENEQKEILQKMSELELKAEKIDDLVIQLEKEKIENQTLRKTYETDKKLWTMKKEIISIKEKGLDSTDDEAKNETSTLIEQSMALADQLRCQIEDDKRIYDEELMSLRKQFESSRNEWAKERKELSKKMKESQEAIRVKEIDRLNILCNQEQNEKDKTKFQNERDLLLQKLQEMEIHQMANKYKLDKIYEQILDSASKCQQLPNTSSNSSFNESQTLLRKVLEQLVVVRDDLSKAKELNKSLAKMPAQSGVGRLLLPPSGADFSDPTSIKSAPLMDKSDQADCSDSPGSHFLTNRHYLSGKSPSVSSDIGPDGRFAGRLRSPSPSPRKITNYPDPPPSIIFNTAHCVEYDTEGRRHWTRKSFMQRSMSLDPAGGNCMLEDQQGDKAASRILDENARLKLMSAVATSTTNLSIGSQSPAYRRRMANIFATLRKSTSRERRKTQCPSVTSPSDQLVEATKSDKSGYDRGRSKVFSGSRILDKLRGRSSSRGQKSGPSRDPSLDTKNAPSSTVDSSSAVAVVKNVEQTAEKRSSEAKASVPPPNATSTPKSDLESTISVKYMRSGSTHSSSALSYKTSSGVGTAKEYVTRGSRTASASNIFSKQDNDAY